MRSAAFIQKLERDFRIRLPRKILTYWIEKEILTNVELTPSGRYRLEEKHLKQAKAYLKQPIYLKYRLKEPNSFTIY